MNLKNVLISNRSGLRSLTAYAALVAAAFALQICVRDFRAPGTAFVPEPPKFLALSLDPRIIRRFLGVRILAADLVWIDTLIKSDIEHEKKDFTTMYHAARVMTALDPDNYFAYYVLGLYLSVIKDDIKGATTFLREGAQSLERRISGRPSGGFSRYFLDVAWHVYFALGYHLLFEEREFEEGAKWIRKAAEIELCPDYILALAKRVSTEIGRLEVGSRILTDLYRRATKPDERKRIEGKLLEIASKQETIELNQRFEAFLSSTGAFALPKKKAFDLFMRSIQHSGRDVLGRRFSVDVLGKIVVSNLTD